MAHYSAYFIDELGTKHVAGELITAESGNDVRMQFRYSPEYLANDDLPSLDPVAIKKGPAPISFVSLPRAFDDCLPGSWGKRWLIRSKGIARSEQRDYQLLKYIDEGHIGGLFFKDKQAPEIQDVKTANRMAQMVFDLDANGKLTNTGNMPTDAVHSSGGMRPKFTATLFGEHKLIKMESSRDTRDIVALEHIAMTFAKSCGLNVAATEIQKFGDRKGLCVQRFDINNAGGRHHKLSMKTLLQADEYTVASYGDMATIIHRYSAAAAADAHQLYKKMLINVVVSNRDDHLRNFELHWIGGGWRLTPAYDILPSEDGEIYHATRFGLNEYVDRWSELLALAKKFKLSDTQACEIRDEIIEALVLLPKIISDSKINDQDASWLTELTSKQSSILK